MALDGKKAAYFGGTVATFNGAKDPVEGRLDTSNVEALILTAEKKPFAGQRLRIPYDKVIDLEYGQKAGRRAGAAVATTVLLGPIGLLALFSKKRNHYLTIGFTDAAGAEQVAGIELGKDIVRTTLPIIETRSKKELQFQDNDARNATSGKLSRVRDADYRPFKGARARETRLDLLEICSGRQIFLPECAWPSLCSRSKQVSIS